MDSDPEVALEEACKAAEAACAQGRRKFPGEYRWALEAHACQPLGRQTADLCLQNLWMAT